MSKCIAILATMDTKGAESDFMRQEIEALGGRALLMDIGVVGEVAVPVDVTNDEVARAGGSSIAAILENPTRQDAAPILIAGATKLLLDRVHADEIQAVIALGGTQGTGNCSQVLQALPYGFPKIMLSTVASGDTAPFVDIKDITMMFSVSDILGLNAFSRKILANTAAGAWGMAQVERGLDVGEGVKGVIGMTNLGVLTNGALHAIDLFHEAGYEVITFHAIGAGGRAMEQMMKEGIITGVFDYAMGEIADEVYGGLRAANETRLTVAGKLGLPQVIVPGGAEHLGILLHEPNTIPDEYAQHQYVFHNPFVFVPRMRAGGEIEKIATTITDRLKHTTKDAVFMIPTRGVCRYSVEGGELVDRESDAAFFETLKGTMPAAVEVRELDHGAEDPEFVEAAVAALIGLIEQRA